jgi:hypothetical protein
MKIFGLILPKGRGARFATQVRARIAEHTELGLVIEPLLAAWHAIDDQVDALERQLVRRARRHAACHRLMTVPGVGPFTALAFVTTVDDPGRFQRSSSVGAYLGLTPRRHQSGERDVSGRISKCGDRLTRSYLFEAANVLLTRVERWSSLKGLGHQAGQAERRQEGESGARAQARHVAAPALAGRHHVPLDSGGHPRDDLILRGSPIGERGPCRDDARMCRPAAVSQGQSPRSPRSAARWTERRETPV